MCFFHSGSSFHTYSFQGPNAVVTFVLLNTTDSRDFFLGEYDADGGIYIFSAREFDYETDKRTYRLVVR